MRSVITLAAFVAVASVVGCHESSSGSDPGATPSASAAASASGAPVDSSAPAASGSSAPAASGSSAANDPPKTDKRAKRPKRAKKDKKDEKVLAITTKAPEAKAAFEKARDFEERGHQKEALEECKKAVAADADFAFGHACVGWLTDGTAGQAELDKAVQLAAKLAEPEKTFIEAWSAAVHLDVTKYCDNMKKVADLAPDDMHAQLWYGRSLRTKRDFPGAEEAFQKALDIDPEASFVFVQLSRVETQLKEYPDALDSAKKYAEAAPKEPGAHQAVGSALLNLDKAHEAEAEFVKAVELGPKVLSAYYDLAITQTILDEFAAARETLEKAKVADSEPDDVVDRRVGMAWVSFAEGKDADGMKELEAIEKEANEKKLPSAGHPALARERIEWITGKAVESLHSAEQELGRCDKRAESSNIEKGICRIGTLSIKGFDEVTLDKVDGAKKTAKALHDEVEKKAKEITSLQVSSDMLNDQVDAMDKKDKKAAAALEAKVLPDDIYWKLSIHRMAQKDDDKPLMAKLRKDILGRPIKDFAFPLIARQLKK